MVAKKCICAICTCGRHHCPLHNKGSNALGGGENAQTGTEYNERYPFHKTGKAQNYKPKQEIARSDAPFEGTTTSKADFTEKPVAIRHKRETAAYEAPSGSMAMHSSYKDDFVEEEKYEKVEKTKAVRPRDNDLLKSTEKFEGASSNKADYREFDPQARQQPIRPQENQLTNEGKFEGLSGYKADYMGHEGARPRTNFKPKQDTIRSDAPFEGQTVNQQDFRQHALPEKQQRRKEEYVPTDAPFEGMTTSKLSYMPKETATAVTESFRPPNKAYQSEAPFEGNSTSRDDFKQWEVKKREKQERAKWEKPEGSFDMNTTSKMDYAERRGSPSKPIRPNQSNLMSGGQFDDSTTAKSDFQKWDVRPRSKVAQENGYRPPSGKFEDSTTNRNSYAPFAGVEKAKSFKPQEAALRSDAPFEGTTSNREAYTAKNMSQCPAIGLIKPGNSSYSYIEEDPRGHQFFESRHGSATSGRYMHTQHA